MAEGAADTKSLILQVALRRFADQGFAATRLTDIADEVGIRRPSLLHHFSSKEALYSAVFEASFADWVLLVEETVSGEARAGWPRVESMLGAAFRYFEEHEDFVRLIRREALDSGPIFTARLTDALKPMFDRAAIWIEAEMDAGRLRRYDARQLVLTGYGAVLSYISDAPFIGGLLGDDPLSPAALKERREHVLDVLRAALEPESD